MLNTLHNALESENQRSLLDMPQHLQTAAETIQEHSQNSSSMSQQKIYINVLERILDVKKKKWMERLNIDSFINDSVPISDHFDEIHNYCAMVVTLNGHENLSSKHFEPYLLKNKNKINRGNFGIIWLNEIEDLNYVHYSLMQYIAARWCSSPTSRECERVMEVRKNIVDGQFSGSQFEKFFQTISDQHQLEGRPDLMNNASNQSLESQQEDAVMQKEELVKCMQWSSCSVTTSLRQAKCNDHDQLSEDLHRLTIDDAQEGRTRESTAVDGQETTSLPERPGAEILQLHRAARGDTAVLERLLAVSSKLSLEAPDADGRSPLHHAAEVGNAAAVRLLLERGALPSSIDLEEITPLHLAARGGHDEAVRLLLEHRADPNAADRGGNTPLLFASQGDHKTTAILLLQFGADMSIWSSP